MHYMPHRHCIICIDGITFMPIGSFIYILHINSFNRIVHYHWIIEGAGGSGTEIQQSSHLQPAHWYINCIDHILITCTCACIHRFREIAHTHTTHQTYPVLVNFQPFHRRTEPAARKRGLMWPMWEDVEHPNGGLQPVTLVVAKKTGVAVNHLDLTGYQYL